MKKFAMALALAAAPLTALVAQNWNAEYATTERGHKVGNPEAPLKLIQFVSYSCSHCATFEHESDAPLRAAYIHEGKLEVEVQHIIRNPIDKAIALMTECGEPEKFFDNHRRMMFGRDVWIEKGRQSTQAQQVRWETGTQAQRMRAIAGDLGLYDLMETRGYSVAELDRCLADPVRGAALDARSDAAKAEYGVPGTPSFALNGELLQNVHSWPALAVALREASQ